MKNVPVALWQGRAEISADQKYRYALWRVWDTEKPLVLFIGLNPSTADGAQDDPTLRRCIRFAQRWEIYGGLCVANLFALRSTDPGQLRTVNDPVGPENDQWIRRLSKNAECAVAVWGNGGGWMQRSSVVRDMIPDLCCLGVNKGGKPRHPLYLKRSTVLQPYRRG